MKEFLERTFTELTTLEPLEIHGIGETPLTSSQLFRLFSVINYRYENLLPTTTYTDKKPFELCKAICEAENIDREILADAIVSRLWEMGVEHFKV